MDLAEQILQAQDLPREAVECPEWGKGQGGKPVTVFVRKPSGLELDAWDNANVRVLPDGRREPDLNNASARLLVKVLEDENGRRLFTDAQAPLLGKKAGDVLGRLFAVAVRLSGRREGDRKNSGPTPAGASSTD